jgi:hypothetical protein
MQKELGKVEYACHPSNLGGGDRKMSSSKPTWAK